MSKKHESFDYREWHKDMDQALNYEENVYADDTYSSYIWEIEKRILLDEVRAIKKSGISYLDFACGTGRVISLIEGHVTESTGIDISPSMLQIAGKKTHKSTLIEADLTSKDIIHDKKYDVITAFRFILNAQEELRREVITILSGKMSKNGILICNTHGNTMSYYCLTVLMSKLGIKREKVNHISYLHMARLIRSANLKLDRVYGIGFLPTFLFRILKPCRSIIKTIDIALMKLQIFRYFAKNVILVCSKVE